MQKDNIIYLLTELGCKKIKVRNNWVMCSCPFAEWFHTNGTDNKPSFGISIDNSSRYHCFTCGKKGNLRNLLFSLEYYREKPLTKLLNFVNENEDIELPKKNIDKELQTIAIEDTLLKKSKLLKSYRDIPENTLVKFNLRYYAEEQRVLIPIHDYKGVLVSIKGRTILKNGYPKYKLYTDVNPKTIGVWFNAHQISNYEKLLFITEGELDAIALSNYVTNVWATMGGKLTEKQIQFLQNSYYDKIFLFLDNPETDKIGKEVREQIIKNITNKLILEPKNYLGCKDPLEAHQKKLIKQIIKNYKIAKEK